MYISYSADEHNAQIATGVNPLYFGTNTILSSSGSILSSSGSIPRQEAAHKLFEDDPIYDQIYDQIDDGTNRQEGALSTQNYPTALPPSANENLKLEKKSLLESGPCDRLDRTPKPALQETICNPYAMDASST